MGTTIYRGWSYLKFYEIRDAAGNIFAHTGSARSAKRIIDECLKKQKDAPKPPKEEK